MIFINTTTLVYQLPFGKSRRFGANWNGLVDAALGGWEVNTINTANSGLPVDVAYTPSSANDVTGRIPDYRGESVMRPNLVGNPAGATGAAMLNEYFNPAAFAVPSPSNPFGNEGRNSFRTPVLWQWDLAVNKSFALSFREGMAVQFRSEFFNVLNHTNFGYLMPTSQMPRSQPSAAPTRHARYNSPQTAVLTRSVVLLLG